MQPRPGGVEMRGWLTKIRGVVGLGAVGGAIGGVLGAGWALVNGVLAWGAIIPENLMVGAMVWGGFGAFAASGFGVLLGAIAARGSLDDLPLWKAGLMGGVAGASFPFAIVVLTGGGLLQIAFPALLSVVGLCGGLGALLTFGMVAIARRGDGPSIGGRESGALPPGSR